jgi:hypothetical protein
MRRYDTTLPHNLRPKKEVAKKQPEQSEPDVDTRIMEIEIQIDVLKNDEATIRQKRVRLESELHPTDVATRITELEHQINALKTEESIPRHKRYRLESDLRALKDEYELDYDFDFDFENY